jgi:opacity protein-like surface antigen
MSKLVIIATLFVLTATAAQAQSWTSQNYGGLTYYHSPNGWSGSSQQYGDQVYSRFQGPGGQMRNCVTQQYGSQTFTNCQ